MDAFKKEHFERDNPARIFPFVEVVPEEETSSIRRRLATKLALHAQDDGLELTRQVRRRSSPLSSPNAQDEGFELKRLLAKIGIDAQPVVYVNWYRFDQIDKLELSALDAHFADIWYPSSDDIEIFDDSLGWVVSVSHHGAVSHLDLGESQMPH